MHLTMPLLPLLLPLLSSPLTLALTTSSSPSTLTQSNTTLPPLLAPSPSNNLTLTGLGAPGPSCFDPSTRALAPVSLDSCLDAITRVAFRLPPSVYLLPRLFKTEAAATEGGTKVPVTWKATDGGGCMMQINSVKGMAGLADAAEFSLIGAAYYASLVVDNCVNGEKISLGGRFVIADRGFFVDVRATLAGESGDEWDSGGVATA